MRDSNTQFLLHASKNDLKEKGLVRLRRGGGGRWKGGRKEVGEIKRGGGREMGREKKRGGGEGGGSLRKTY